MKRQSLAEQVLTPEMRAEIDHWISKYPPDRKQSAVIPALHVCQDANGGWLKQEHLDAIAEYLGIAPATVYEVANFYSMFDLKPCGRHKVNICTNISCMLRGGYEVLEAFESKLGLKRGQSSAKFTLVEEECIAACDHAPCALVGTKYFYDITPAQVGEIIAELEREPHPEGEVV